MFSADVRDLCQHPSITRLAWDKRCSFLRCLAPILKGCFCDTRRGLLPVRAAESLINQAWVDVFVAATIQVHHRARPWHLRHEHGGAVTHSVEGEYNRPPVSTSEPCLGINA